MSALEGRVRLMLSRGIVRLVDDTPGAQEMQIDLLEDESQDGVERLQNYGFTSVPKPDAEAVVGCMGGLRSHAIVLAVEDRRFRLVGLEEGEVAIYDDLGNMVKLGRERVEIVAMAELKITAPLTKIEGDVEVTGEVTVTGDVTADGISLKTHVHGGVQAGASNTGAPA